MASTFVRKVSNNIGNVATTVGSYTVAANTGAVVIGLTVANTSNVEVAANVSIYNGITDYYLVKLAPIPAEGSLVLIGGDQKAVLQATDSIRVSSTVNNSVDVIMTLLETDSIGMTIDPIGAGPVTITANVSSVDEGNTVAFSVSNITANAFAYGNGTYYWTTNSVTGTITAADFADSANTGSFTVTNGSGTISRTISADITTEGTEIFTISVREGSTSGTVIVTSGNITIADTSFKTYSISANVSSVNEGNTVGFSVTTTNVSDNTILYWTTIGNVVAGDFTDNITSGNTTIISNSATITRTISADITTEGNEYFALRLRTDSISGNIVSTSANVQVIDTSTEPLPLNEAYYSGTYYPGITSSTAANSPKTSFTLLSNIASISANVGASSLATYQFTYIKSTDQSWQYYAPNGLDIGSSSTYLPAQVGSGTWKFVAVSFGTGSFMFGINTSGELYACGAGGSGQLGLNNTATRTYTNVAKVGSATNWTKVAAAARASIGLQSDGTVWCWGLNSGTQAGQLGLGGTSDVLVPTQVGTDTDWVDIAAAIGSGGGNAGTIFYGIKSNGTLWYWGAADNGGGLGAGDVFRTSPTQIGVSTNWAKVYGAYRGARLIKTNGTLWGPYSSTSYSGGTFQQIGTDTDWASSGGGTYNWHAIKTNGTLWAISVYNFYGSAGDGTTTDVLVPKQIGSDTNWRIVPPGGSYEGTVAIK